MGVNPEPVALADPAAAPKRAARLDDHVTRNARARPAMRTEYLRDRAAPRPTWPPTWLAQFEAWFDDAVAAGLPEPNAMVLATADAGRPAQRPDRAAQGRRRAWIRLVHQLHLAQGHRDRRQPVRQPGLPLAPDRPPGRRRGPGRAGRPGRDRGLLRHPAARRRSSGAWASPQSQVVPDRAALDEALAEVERAVRPDGPTAPPPHWGGLRVRAGRRSSSGRAARAGCTTGCGSGGTGRQDQTGWVVERLAP